MLETGQVLAQRYEIRRKLGKGGSACVYLAFDRVDGRNRALKEVKKAGKGKGSIGICQEAEVIRELKYPYFPAIYDVLTAEEAEYMVMEYLEGEALGERLRRLGPQPWQEVQRWGRDLCLMLHYLHQCIPMIVYQDMKPDNVMIQPRGNLRLIDFGAVMNQRDGGLQQRLGTRGYAAPEQFDCDSRIDARTDIYGLGQTMYELLTGKNPREGGWKKIFSVKQNFPRKLDRILRKCINENPAERYQDCQELREALRGI